MNKTLLLFTLICMLSLVLPAQIPTAWINEFHYDNVGTDQGEFVEIVVLGEQYQRASWSLVLYNGGNGASYGTVNSLASFTEGDSLNQMRFFYFVFASNGIQNGSPDGFALCFTDSLSITHIVDGISYEGSFMASSGPATGLILSDIYQSESNTNTPLAFSLQLNGDSKLQTWLPPAAQTPGMPNMNTTLPVIFLQLGFESSPGRTDMIWTTASELNCSHFNVQLSIDGVHFLTSGSIPASGTSSMPNQYRCQVSVDNHSYARIEAVDFDGHLTHSSLISVDSEPVLPFTLSISEYGIAVSSEGNLGIKLFGLDGSIIESISSYDWVQIRSPSAGIYILWVECTGYAGSFKVRIG